MPLVFATEQLAINLAGGQKDLCYTILLDQALHQVQVLRGQELTRGADDDHGMAFMQFIKCAFFTGNDGIVDAGRVHHL